MSLNYQKDPAAQVPTLATGLDGVDSIVKFYEDGTNELKNLLKNECSIIFECSYCRSLFRSIVNFVAHKRTICRSLQTSVQLELQRAVTTDKSSGSIESEKNSANTSNTIRTRRNPYSLRRVNLASLLGKHIQSTSINLDQVQDSIEIQTLPKISRPLAITSIQNGKQIIENLPAHLSVKERVPDDRTVLVMPQDNSIRYREMQLRTRRALNDTKALLFRELAQRDVEILQRIPSTLCESANFQEMRCLHENCAHIPPFASIAILAHHLAITHQKAMLNLVLSDGMLGCFICGKKFIDERSLKTHFNNFHNEERVAHMSQRASLAKADEKAPPSRTANRKKRSSSPDEKGGGPRFRSISPSDASARSSVESVARLGEDASGENSRLDGGTCTTSELNESGGSASPRASESIEPAPRRTRRRRQQPPPQQQQQQRSAAANNGHNNGGAGNSESRALTRRSSSRQQNNSGNITPFKSEAGETSPNKRAKLELNENRVITPLINIEEARRLDEFLNTTSAMNASSLLKHEESYESNQTNEKSPIKADKAGTSSGRQQRSKKPTKRFYNEDFVVDPTKTKEPITTTTTATMTTTKPIEVKKKSKASDSFDGEESDTPEAEFVDDMPKLKPSVILKTSMAARRAKPGSLRGVTKRRHRGVKSTQNGKSMTMKPPNENIDDKEDDKTHRKTSKERENSIELGVLPNFEQQRNYVEDITDLQTRKEVIDRVLRTEVDSRESLLSIRQITELLTPTKAISEPPSAVVDRLDGSPLADRRYERATSTAHFASEAENNAEANLLPAVSGVDMMTESDDAAAKTADFVLPPSSNNDSSVVVATSSSLATSAQTGGNTSVRKQLPSVLADKNRELLAFYTPRALKARIIDEKRNSEVSITVGSSRRKQNLKDVSGVAQKNEPPPRPNDLAEIPVYLTEAQRDMFFSPLRPLFNSASASDGLYQCSECGEVLRCQRDGRRHMVGHLRVMRIRCMLCDVGAFFCGDMRIHLMFRHCEKLNLAPEGFVEPGDVVPCMDKQKADSLTQLVDPFHPGRVFFTSGKIISWTNPKAYFPDPRIEERILGKARPRRSTSLAPSPVKPIMSSTATGSPGPCKKLNFDLVASQSERDDLLAVGRTECDKL